MTRTSRTHKPCAIRNIQCTLTEGVLFLCQIIAKYSVSAIVTNCAWCFAVFVIKQNTAKHHSQSVTMALTEDLAMILTQKQNIFGEFICFLLPMHTQKKETNVTAALDAL